MKDFNLSDHGCLSFDHVFWNNYGHFFVHDISNIPSHITKHRILNIPRQLVQYNPKYHRFFFQDHNFLNNYIDYFGYSFCPDNFRKNLLSKQ